MKNKLRKKKNVGILLRVEETNLFIDIVRNCGVVGFACTSFKRPKDEVTAEKDERGDLFLVRAPHSTDNVTFLIPVLLLFTLFRTVQGPKRCF